MDGSQVSLPKKSGSRDPTFGLIGKSTDEKPWRSKEQCHVVSDPTLPRSSWQPRGARQRSAAVVRGWELHLSNNHKTLRRWSIQMFFGTPNHVDVENICSKIMCIYIYYDILIHGGIILKLLISRTQEINRWCQDGAAPGKAQRGEANSWNGGAWCFFRSQWQQEQQLSTLDLGSKKKQ